MEYTITLNEQYKSYEVSFTGKPDKDIRDNLKALKFRWNPKKSIWYGFGEKDALVAALSGETTIDNKIKPIETGGSFSEGYLGNRRWDGIHAHEQFELKDINKYLKKLCKQNYGVNIKTKYKSYSGGESTDIYVILNEDAFISIDELLELYNTNPFDSINQKYNCDIADIHSFINKSAFGNEYDFNNEWINNYNKASDAERKEIITNWYETEFKISGRETACRHSKLWFLNKNYQDAVKAICDTFDSYKYDDSNGMVDYFDTNFYYFVYLVFPTKTVSI